MRIHPLPEPEASYFRRFFNAADRALSAEMSAGRSLLEENLTFLLCRLLDGESTFQRVLDYSLDQLNADLRACGTGQRLEITFETHEHSRAYEAAVSRADLGIVFHRDAGPDHPSVTKALLVQSKKLYPASNGYTLGSGYDAFDVAQYRALKAFADAFDQRAVYYFTYNPALLAFAERDQEGVRAIESTLSASAKPNWFGPGWHPEMGHMMHRLLRRGVTPGFGPALVGDPDVARADRLREVQDRPGLRVLSVRSVGQIVEKQKSIRPSFSLKDCYRYAVSDDWWHSDSTVPFLPLAAFMTDMLAGCFAGSTESTVIDVASGRAQKRKHTDASADIPGIAARHTLRVSIRSTLPEGTDMFLQ